MRGYRVLPWLLLGACQTLQPSEPATGAIARPPAASSIEVPGERPPASLIPSDETGEDWPRFLGPRADGTSAETGLLASWPVEGPRQLWSRALGASYSGPVTSRGRLVAFHRVGDQEVVEAVDARSGEAVWRASYPTAYVDQYGYNGGPRSSPVIEGNRVYTFGAEGKLTCLDFESGEILWQRWINRDFQVPQNFFGVGSSPLVAEDLILLNAGGLDGASVVALDRHSGETVWKTGRDGASYSTPVLRELHGEWLAIFLTREGLLVLEPSSGAERYRFPFRPRSHLSVSAASPVVVDHSVFLSASYRAGAVLLDVKPDGLEVVWKDPLAMRNHWATSIVHEGYLYGMDGRHEAGSRFRCLDFRTGEVQWTAEQGLGRAAFILAEGKLIALGERGVLALIEATPDGYLERARAQVLDYPCWTPPVLSHGLLYVRNETRLVCLNLRESRPSTRASQDDQGQTGQKQQEHEGDQPSRARRGFPELLPDEDPPQRRHHGGSLSQAVGDGKSRLSRGNDVEGHPDTPDNTAEDADQVGPGIAPEVGRNRYRLP